MNITNQILYNKINPTFGTYSEHRSTGPYTYWTSTKFFREDLNWNDFVFMLFQKYKGVPQVNIRCFGCSDGEEPFSLAMKLDVVLGKYAEKFFPIVAKDFDKSSILYAKKGNLAVKPREYRSMENECGMRLDKYMITGEPYKISFEGPYEDDVMIPVNIKDSLKEKVIFSYADILKDVKNIPAKNTVLMTRNMWPYLPSKKQTFLAEALSKQLDETSLLVLGDFDLSNGTHKLLEEFGFEMTEIYGIMQKKAKKILADNPADAKVMYNKIKAAGKSKLI